MIVQPHGHNSNHIVFVLEGDMTCGDVHCPAGTHIALDQGDTFGPFVAGPERRRAVRGDDGRPALLPGRRGRLRRFLAERDVQQLPNPPIELPEFVHDTRRDHRVVNGATDGVTDGVPFAAAPPFATGSVSFRSYPHDELDAEARSPSSARRRGSRWSTGSTA